LQAPFAKIANFYAKENMAPSPQIGTGWSHGYGGRKTMIVQFVQFETSLSEKDVTAVARERLPQFRAIPSLVQKYYLKLDKPNRYGGFYIWESPEAMAAFRDSELAKTIPAAYQVVGAPDVGIHQLMFPLRAEPAALALAGR
jgi:hypothetical protein